MIQRNRSAIAAGLAASLAALATSLAALGVAGEPDPLVELDDHALARSLSLDLRGRPLSPDDLAELEAAADTDALIDGWIDAWTDDAAFREEVVWQHRLLFWNSLSYKFLTQRNLVESDDGIYYLNQRADDWRGVNKVSCSDHPAQVDAAGRPVTWTEGEDGALDEGWVEVSPYWDPDDPVKVCAWDAQYAAVSDEGTDCAGADADGDLECGCGPDLQWCLPPDMDDLITEGLAAALDQRVRHALEQGLPYTELLAGQWGMVNGPLAHFYAHLYALDEDLGSPYDAADLPALDPLDADTWVEVPGLEHTSGALTEGGWLLRHQTDRGRANRFYGAFLCAEFVPPEGGLEGLDGDDPSPDLTVREGCRDCHVQLEPWAAWWGRWQESGSGYLAPEEWPAYRVECAECAWEDRSCNAAEEDGCKDHYLYAIGHGDDAPWAGFMHAYVYQTGDASAHPDEGPGAWVDEAAADGRLARCAARNVGRWLLQTDPDGLEAGAVDGWADAFTASNYDYAELVRAVARSEVYRRVR